MTTVSASTLARRASKTKNPALAKRYRAQAAKLRREEREAKAFQASTIAELDGLKRAKKPRPMTGLGEQTINRALASVDHTPLTAMVNQEQPGHGEIVGGYLSRKAEEITKIARKKGGIDGVQMHLRAMEITARGEAHWDAKQREHKAVQAVREEMRDKSVCGFIAKFDASEAFNSLTPAAIMSIDEIRNLVAALKANGYHADGKR